MSTGLQAERGTSYEAGLRGKLGQERLMFDVAVFDLTLNQTIVTRGLDAGVTVFANAGTTRQRGVEAALSGWLWRDAAAVPSEAGQPPPAACAPGPATPTAISAFSNTSRRGRPQRQPPHRHRAAHPQRRLGLQ
ncbi:MAG: TonB-dependent receptor [Hymenobacter sp.]